MGKRRLAWSVGTTGGTMAASDVVLTTSPPIMLAAGYAKPIRWTFFVILAALLGMGAAWIGLQFSVWNSAKDFIFLWLVPWSFAVLFGASSVLIFLSILLGYPRISLEDGWLVYQGLVRTRRYELATLGKAHAIHSGTLYNTMTILAFFSAAEEAALAKNMTPRHPTGLNATKQVALTVSVGNDLVKAQEIADQINVYRQSYIGDATISHLSVKDVKRRLSKRITWGAIAVILACMIPVLLNVFLPD